MRLHCRRQQNGNRRGHNLASADEYAGLWHAAINAKPHVTVRSLHAAFQLLANKLLTQLFRHPLRQLLGNFGLGYQTFL